MVASMVTIDGIRGRATTVEEKAGSCDCEPVWVSSSLFGFPLRAALPRTVQNRMASRLLVVAAVANAALAYLNTAPVVAWSSS